MKIITWNINSVRLRINLLKVLVEKENPDIICLQETKVVDDLFPEEEIRLLGFEYIIFVGEKSYNGVAILSKIPLTKVIKLKLVNDNARHISATLPGGVEIHNFYIPAGGDEPNPEINPKFKHKLDYCQAMTKWFSEHKTRDDKIIIVGDLNIAPLENDVWSHKQLLSVVSHTPIEVENLNKIYDSIGFVDVMRKFFPVSKKLYSWWSYRNKDWKKSNRGRRLDHIWTTAFLGDRIEETYMLVEARDWEKPSDHVPVIAKFANII